MQVLARQDITDTRLPGKRALVVGLGKTGLSCVRFLLGQGIDVAVTDSRKSPACLKALHEELPDVAVFVNGFNAKAFSRADFLLVSPGVSLREPLIAQSIARGVPVFGDIELFARYTKAPVIAITGSNGKSTVTSLVGEMVRCAGRTVQVGANLGEPVLDLLRNHSPDLYVLELSSFQLESTDSLNPLAATVLNVSQDHMDRYTDLADYSAAKAKIYAGNGIMVVNADDHRVLEMAQATVRGKGDTDRKRIHFSMQVPKTDDYGVVDHQGEDWLAKGTDKEALLLLPITQLKIHGRHNIANALAALALGEAVGLTLPIMLEVLRAYSGLPHRTQKVAQIQGVDWYNDSKATNVGAALAALQGIPGECLVLIAGGQGKGQDFAPLRDALAQRGRAVVLLGEDASLLADTIGSVVPVEYVADMPQAVNMAARLAKPGDAVVLSPACASFDMFSGFEQRGEIFTAAVLEQQA